MTDRELLEYAAKSAGIPLRDLDDQWDNWEPEPVRIHRGWNPLTDDGDAFRLGMSVKSVLKIELKTNHVRVTEDESGLVITEDYNGDPYAATRRAIVRTAAEIGKGME